MVIALCPLIVVGWATATRLRAGLAGDALRMALIQRKPKVGLLHHSFHHGVLQKRHRVRLRLNLDDKVIRRWGLSRGGGWSQLHLRHA